MKLKSYAFDAYQLSVLDDHIRTYKLLRRAVITALSIDDAVDQCWMQMRCDRVRLTYPVLPQDVIVDRPGV